jgi:hypothetical protein
MRTNTTQVVVVGWTIILAVLQGCSKASDKVDVSSIDNADVKFAKTAFFSMVNNSGAGALIDWETFKAMGDDMGADYKSYPTIWKRPLPENHFCSVFQVRSQHKVKSEWHHPLASEERNSLGNHCSRRYAVRAGLVNYGFKARREPKDLIPRHDEMTW